MPLNCINLKIFRASARDPQLDFVNPTKSPAGAPDLQRVWREAGKTKRMVKAWKEKKGACISRV